MVCFTGKAFGRVPEAIRRFGLSPPFQCGVQAVAGVFLTGLFVVVKPLNFPLSCLAALFMTVAMVVLSPDNHVGTRLAAGATMMGGMVWGLTAGGVVLTLARLAAPPHCTGLVGCGGHTAALCCLGLLALAVFVSCRAALGPPHPPSLWLAGMVAVLGCGLTLVAGQLTEDIRAMWRNIVGGLLLSGVLGFGVCSLCSMAVLPSLAADEMRGDTAAALRGIGHAAGRLASRALVQQLPPPQQRHKQPPSRAAAPAGRQLYLAPAEDDHTNGTAAALLPLPSGRLERERERERWLPVGEQHVRPRQAALQGDEGRGVRLSQSPDPLPFSHGRPHDTSIPTPRQRPYAAEPASEGPSPPPHVTPTEPTGPRASGPHAPAAGPPPSRPGASPPRQRLPGARSQPSLERWDGTAPAACGGSERSSCSSDAEEGPARQHRQPEQLRGVSGHGPVSVARSTSPSRTTPPSPHTHTPRGFAGAGTGTEPAQQFRRASTSSLGTSYYTSDEEGWPYLNRRPRDPRVTAKGTDPWVDPHDEAGDFEHVMEDEDDFLRLLHEATAPHLPPSRRSVEARGLPRSVAAAARLPPRPVALPGGILPSPSVHDLQSMPSASKKHRSKSGSGLAPAVGVARAGGGAGAAAVAADAEHMPGGGPSTAHGGGLAGGAVAWAPVSALRPLLARARACLGSAGVEPRWMCSAPTDLGAWSRVLDTCGALLDRVAALECLAEDTRVGGPVGHSDGPVGHSVLGDARLEELLGTDVLAPYRRVYGEVAAGCAAMAAAVEESYTSGGARRRGAARAATLTAVGGWAAARQELAAHIRDAMASYWARVRAGGGGACGGAASLAGSASSPALHTLPAVGGGGDEVSRLAWHRPHHHHHHARGGGGGRGGKIRILSLHQSRALTFLWTVTEGVLGAMAELEAALRAALGAHQAAPGPASDLAPGPASCPAPAPAPAPTITPDAQPDAQCGLRTAYPAAATAAAATAAPRIPNEGPSPATPPGDGREGWDSGSDGSTRSPRDTSCAGVVAAEVRTRDEEEAEAAPPVAVVGTAAGAAKRGGAAPMASLEPCHSRGGGGGVSGTAAAPDAGAEIVVQLGSVPAQSQDGAAAGNGAAALSPPFPPVQCRARSIGGGSPAKPLLGRIAGALRDEWLATVPLIKLTLGIPLVQALPGLMTSNLALLFTNGPAGRSGLLSSRAFQFGAKYWVTTSAVLCLILGLAARRELGVMRHYSMLYPFIATTISMTERVESTLSRAALRAWGTLAGSVLGLAVMVHPPLARSGAAVLAILCALTFLTGCQFGHRLLYGFTLALITLQSLVLCQHGSSCCDTPRATAELFYVRLGSVLLGCTVPVLASQAVLPWYTSDWALERMAGAVSGAAGLARRLYRQTYEEHLRAHLASRGLDATCQLLRRWGHEAEAHQLGADVEAEAGRRGAPGTDVVNGDAGGQKRAERAGAGGGAGGAGASPPAAASAATASAELQSLVSGPLVAVQTSLMKDAAVWTRGIYATPAIVPPVLRACLHLAERLAALSLVVCDTPPVVEGRLSGWAFGELLLPLHGEMEAMFDVIDRLAAATARLLDPTAAAAALRPTHASGGGPCAQARRHPDSRDASPVGKAEAGAGAGAGAGQAAAPRPSPAASAAVPAAAAAGDAVRELQEAIGELDQRRLQIRQHIHDMRRAFHASVRQVDEQQLPYATHPDDTIRFNSMLYALVKVMDKATAVARTALEYRRREASGRGSGGSWWAWARGSA